MVPGMKLRHLVWAAPLLTTPASSQSDAALPQWQQGTKWSECSCVSKQQTRDYVCLEDDCQGDQPAADTQSCQKKACTWKDMMDLLMRHGDSDALKEELTRDGWDVNVLNGAGQTLLQWAMDQNHQSFVQVLLDMKLLDLQEGHQGAKALLFLARIIRNESSKESKEWNKNITNLVEKLVSKGVSAWPEGFGEKPPLHYDLTSLMWAAYSRNAEMVECLLKSIDDDEQREKFVNWRLGKKMTALQWVLYMRFGGEKKMNIKIVKLLVDNGVNLLHKDTNGDTAVEIALNEYWTRNHDYSNGFVHNLIKGYLKQIQYKSFQQFNESDKLEMLHLVETILNKLNWSFWRWDGNKMVCELATNKASGVVCTESLYEDTNLESHADAWKFCTRKNYTLNTKEMIEWFRTSFKAVTWTSTSCKEKTELNQTELKLIEVFHGHIEDLRTKCRNREARSLAWKIGSIFKDYLPEWQQGTQWSECSATCGSGEQTRDYVCPEKHCQGDKPAAEKRPCHKKACKQTLRRGKRSVAPRSGKKTHRICRRRKGEQADQNGTPRDDLADKKKCRKGCKNDPKCKAWQFDHKEHACQLFKEKPTTKSAQPGHSVFGFCSS